MNKGEIRTRVLEQVDWNPSQSAAFKAKVDRLINRAYQTLSLEAPFLFFDDEARLITQKDVTSDTSDTSDRLAVNSTDKYVLERSYLSTATAPQAWKTDATWDGRMIEVELSDGTIFWRRIREVWRVTTGSPYYFDRISIDTPWPNNSDTAMKYRIFTPNYYIPADVVELRSARIWSDTHYQLTVATQQDMERFEYIDYRGDENGRPTSIFRGRHRQIDAPNVAPVAKLESGKQFAQWLGPEPAGIFDYCYTYVWGKRDPELQSPQGHYEPLWESAPSPVSRKVEMEEKTAYQSIKLTLPNIDHELNFYQELSGSSLVTPIRSTHSGLKKRIYVRRYSSFAPPTTFPAIESPEIFFLLAEVDGSVESYTHDGSVIPDYYRRIKEVHGYQSVRFWPMPDEAYDIDLRVLRRPQPLAHDHDAPRIHEEGIDLLIRKVLSFFYEMQGNQDIGVLSEQKYQDLLQTLTKRYGNLNRLHPRKKPARVRRMSREVRVRYRE